MTKYPRIVVALLALLITLSDASLAAHGVNHNDSAVQCQLCKCPAQPAHVVPVIAMQAWIEASGNLYVTELPFTYYLPDSHTAYFQRAPPFSR